MMLQLMGNRNILNFQIGYKGLVKAYEIESFFELFCKTFDFCCLFLASTIPSFSLKKIILIKLKRRRFIKEWNKLLHGNNRSSKKVIYFRKKKMYMEAAKIFHTFHHLERMLIKFYSRHSFSAEKILLKYISWVNFKRWWKANYKLELHHASMKFHQFLIRNWVSTLSKFNFF